jgi:hypothetical protein
MSYLHPSARIAAFEEAQEEEARAAFAAEVKRLQAQQDRLCEELAEIKVRALVAKALPQVRLQPGSAAEAKGRSWGARTVGQEP